MLSIFDSIIRLALSLSWNASSTFHKPSHPQYPHHSPSTSLSSHESIPGGSPLKYCNESRSTDLYQIEHIELLPQPLHIDDVFEVHLYGNPSGPNDLDREKLKPTSAPKGTFLQNITSNATWTFSAMYNHSGKAEGDTLDFCTSMDSIDQPDPKRTQECPPEKGFALIMMSAWVMPMFIVPGPSYFKFDAMTKEDERIYCLEAEIYLDYGDEDSRRS